MGVARPVNNPTHPTRTKVSVISVDVYPTSGFITRSDTTWRQLVEQVRYQHRNLRLFGAQGAGAGLLKISLPSSLRGQALEEEAFQKTAAKF